VARINGFGPPLPNPTEIPPVVWSPIRGEPTKEHASYTSAEAEARRLAAKHPKVVFKVLRVVEELTGECVVKSKKF
jgi:hypothetical protein